MTGEGALELGRLIGQSSEYKALKFARERVEDVPELKREFEEMARLAQSLQKAVLEGGEPSKTDSAEYERLHSEIQGNPVYQNLVVAQSNFDKVMTRVHEQILEGIEKGASSPIITLG